MDESLTQTAKPGPLAPHLPDDVSVRHWFATYAALLLAAGVALALIIDRQHWSWQAWRHDFLPTLRATGPAVKLLVFGIYVSLCCTFLPLPTGGIVAAVATREAAVGPDVVTTTLLVAGVGAFASMIANLNDYHLFTWMLRHHRIARVRTTRTYQAAARWFGKAPFFLLVLFNVIPIPVDVVRMLATTYRYPRVPFAGANFIGRFIRYAVIAFVTYWWDLGWEAAVVLLALAAVLGGTRVVRGLVRRLSARPTNPAQAHLSEPTGDDPA